MTKLILKTNRERRIIGGFSIHDPCQQLITSDNEAGSENDSDDSSVNEDIKQMEQVLLKALTTEQLQQMVLQIKRKNKKKNKKKKSKKKKKKKKKSKSKSKRKRGASRKKKKNKKSSRSSSDSSSSSSSSSSDTSETSDSSSSSGASESSNDLSRGPSGTKLKRKSIHRTQVAGKSAVLHASALESHTDGDRTGARASTNTAHDTHDILDLAQPLTVATKKQRLY